MTRAPDKKLSEVGASQAAMEWGACWAAAFKAGNALMAHTGDEATADQLRRALGRAFLVGVLPTLTALNGGPLSSELIAEIKARVSHGD